MNHKTIVLILAICSIGHATTFVALAGDANDCVQMDYAAVCPLPIDPNLLAGCILGPVAGDPNVWKIPAGKFNRVGLACDPNGEALDRIELVAGTVPATVTLDPAAGTWLLTADLEPGLHAFTVKLTDQPRSGDAASRTVTIVVEAIAPINHQPVLTGLGWLGAGMLLARWRVKRKESCDAD